jgi:hypothetical protein
MEKKRGRVITGWRHVGHSKTGLSKSRATEQRGDTEGGHFAEPGKHPVEPAAHPAAPIKHPFKPAK